MGVDSLPTQAHCVFYIAALMFMGADFFPGFLLLRVIYNVIYNVNGMFCFGEHAAIKLHLFL